MSTAEPARRPPGRLESEVHAAIAAVGEHGATVADITAAVDPALAYTTVVTTLTRLVQRGVLTRRRAGRSVRFTVAGDAGAVAATATARRMHRLLAASGNRSGALARFVADLDPSDERRLAELLTLVGSDRAPGGGAGDTDA